MRAPQLVFWVNHQVTPGRTACEGPGPAAHIPSCKHGFLVLTSINFQYKCVCFSASPLDWTGRCSNLRVFTLRQLTQSMTINGG